MPDPRTPNTPQEQNQPDMLAEVMCPLTSEQLRTALVAIVRRSPSETWSFTHRFIPRLHARLEKGDSIESIFARPSDDSWSLARFSGYSIGIERVTPHLFEIDIGYLAGPCAGSGVKFRVAFDDNWSVTDLTKLGEWIS